MSQDELNKHIKKTTSTVLPDGTIQILADSYYEKLAHSQTELKKLVPTSSQTILKDVLSCLDLVTQDKSPEVTIRIISKRGDPSVIEKTWVVSKENFDRR